MNHLLHYISDILLSILVYFVTLSQLHRLYRVELEDDSTL